MNSDNESLRETARLIGYDGNGLVVYEANLSVYEYYDGDHLWDHADQILARKLVHLKGVIHDPSGEVAQKFDNHYDKDTGLYVGGRTHHLDDDTFICDGMCSEE